MEDLYFAVSWGNQEKIDKQNSWSGTNYQMFQHLQEYYHVIEVATDFVNIPVLKPLAAVRKAERILGYNDMELGEISLMNRVLKKKLPDSATVFSFTECPDCSIGERHFIYQDLSALYLYQMQKKSPRIFEVSGFKDNSTRTLRKRSMSQKSYYEGCDGIFTMSQWLADFLSRKYKDKVHHVGGGANIDSSRIVDGEKEGNKFLFVGRDFIRKNGDLVVRSFIKLHEKYPDTELYIAGPEHLEIDEAGVHCLGDLSYDQLLPYFNACDYFVLPSLFEAYGLVFPEALTFGLPCIGRDAYEMPYFIEEGKTGLLLEHNSSDELAGLMEQLLLHPSFKENVMDKRQWYIEEYSWDTVVRRIASVIG